MTAPVVPTSYHPRESEREEVGRVSSLGPSGGDLPGIPNLRWSWASRADVRRSIGWSLGTQPKADRISVKRGTGLHSPPLVPRPHYPLRCNLTGRVVGPSYVLVSGGVGRRGVPDCSGLEARGTTLLGLNDSSSPESRPWKTDPLCPVALWNGVRTVEWPRTEGVTCHTRRGTVVTVLYTQRVHLVRSGPGS